MNLMNSTDWHSKICALLRYYAASSGNPPPTFRDNVAVPSSRAKKSFSSRTSWPFKMGPICCPETSVEDYHSTPRNIPEQRRPHQYRGGRLKALKFRTSLDEYRDVHVSSGRLRSKTLTLRVSPWSDHYTRKTRNRVVTCACELILLFSVAFLLVRAVHRIHLMLVTNWTPNKQRPVESVLVKTHIWQDSPKGRSGTLTTPSVSNRSPYSGITLCATRHKHCVVQRDYASRVPPDTQRTASSYVLIIRQQIFSKHYIAS
jgi:hypothetical protein